MTDDEASLLTSIINFDGYQVHRDYWRVAEALKRQGLIILGETAGPWDDWLPTEPTDAGLEAQRSAAHSAQSDDAS